MLPSLPFSFSLPPLLKFQELLTATEYNNCDFLVPLPFGCGVSSSAHPLSAYRVVLHAKRLGSSRHIHHYNFHYHGRPRVTQPTSVFFDLFEQSSHF